MTTNIDLAKKIAQHVELMLVTLRKADINAEFDPFCMPEDVELVQQYRCAYDTSSHADHGRIGVLVELNFSAREKSATPQDDDSTENTGRDIVTLDATFLLVYSLDKNLTIDPICLEHFANVNGPYNVWPYWRELVQTAVGRVGFGGITVPVFRPMAFEVKDPDCMNPSS